MIYTYLKKGTWTKHDQPKKGIQHGFFATIKNGKIGEVTWECGDIIKRASTQKELFAWLHDNVPIPFWRDMTIRRIKQKNNEE